MHAVTRLIFWRRTHQARNAAYIWLHRIERVVFGRCVGVTINFASRVVVIGRDDAGPGRLPGSIGGSMARGGKRCRLNPSRR